MTKWKLKHKPNQPLGGSFVGWLPRCVITWVFLLGLLESTRPFAHVMALGFFKLPDTHSFEQLWLSHMSFRSRY